MGNVRTLRQATDRRDPPRSEARAALAVAIARYVEKQREIDGASAAIESLLMQRIAATEAVEAAERAIADAKERTTQHHIATALGKTVDRPLSIREAHAAHQAALDEHGALSDAGEALEAQRRGLEANIGVSRLLRDNAIGAVIQSEAGELARRLAVEYEAVARDLADRHRVLEWLAAKGAFGNGPRWSPRADWPDLSGVKAWIAVASELMADPDAPLPTPAPEPKSAA